MVNQESFSELSPGDKAVILGFKKGADGYSQKLRSLGFMPGTQIEVMRTAPLGDPIEVKVRGFNLSLRRHEATHVLVEKI